MATDTTIINNSSGPILVNNVEVTGKNNWTVEDYNTDLSVKRVGSEIFGFYINGDATTSVNNGVAKFGFNQVNWPSINSGKELPVNYNATIAPQKEALNKEIATVTFTVGWDLSNEVLNPPSLETTSLSLEKGSTGRIEVNNTSGKPVTYTSNDTDIVTVSNEGLVEAVGWGDTTIDIQVGTSTNLTCDVSVPKIATGISIDNTSATLEMGKTLQLTATTSYRSTITWSSSNTSVATVDSTGLVTAKKIGDAVITASMGSFKATCNLTITGQSFVINKSNRGLIGYKDGATNFVIPETFVSDGITYTVTEINYNAFKDEANLKTISIPKSVNRISTGDYQSFSGCTALTAINVNAYNKNFSSENGVLFNKDKTELLSYPEGKVGDTYNIPNSVSTIGEKAFENARLKIMHLDNNIKEIKDKAFKGCASLTEVIIPDSMDRIEDHVFYECKSLKNVVIPDTINSFGFGVFYACSSLESISLPNGITEIPMSLFQDCDSLKSITIPEGVTKIGDRAFYNCDLLRSVILPSTVTSIERYAFYYCYNFNSITIPDSVTTIGESALGNCTKLQAITIPNGVNTIGKDAFINVPQIYYNGSATGSPWGALKVN